MTKKKEEKEKRLMRNVNEDVLGLLVDDRDTAVISEAFGWNNKQMEEAFNTLNSYWKFKDAVNELEKDLPEDTKVSIFVDYLKSSNFKRIGIKIDQPNDYFMLGYILAMAIAVRESDSKERSNAMGMGMGGGIPFPIPAGMNPETLLKLLKRFRKFLEEEQQG